MTHRYQPISVGARSALANLESSQSAQIVGVHLVRKRRPASVQLTKDAIDQADSVRSKGTLAAHRVLTED